MRKTSVYIALAAVIVSLFTGCANVGTSPSPLPTTTPSPRSTVAPRTPRSVPRNRNTPRGRSMTPKVSPTMPLPGTRTMPRTNPNPGTGTTPRTSPMPHGRSTPRGRSMPGRATPRAVPKATSAEYTLTNITDLTAKTNPAQPKTASPGTAPAPESGRTGTGS